MALTNKQIAYVLGISNTTFTFPRPSPNDWAPWRMVE
jgi:hypothetical protein